ncbi:hypothetical protein DFH06DRAFT_480521 [Mycena polygramma]|nr:hypothetical protein DFH06DRAFT_480521 [Mycena polygramma]
MGSLGSLENDQNQFLAYPGTKLLESSVQDEYNPPTRALTIPLLPANGDSLSSALKRKHSKLELSLSPCRTPDRVTLTLQVAPSIPLLNFPKSKPAPDVRANTINEAETLRVQTAATTTNGPDETSLGMVEGHAVGEGPHDLPPIEILPEIASPMLSTRRAASPSSPILASAAPPTAVSTVPSINAVASASAPQPPPAADPDSRAPDRRANTYAQRYLRPPVRTTARRLAHPYPTHELDVAPAPVGQLRGGEPWQGVEGAAAWVERVRGEIGTKETEVDVDAKRGWRVQSRPNTAPSAAYAALLEDAFGPGRVLRGEGEKPVPVLGKRVGKGGKRKEGQSVSGGSRSDAMEVDGQGEQASEVGWSATGSVSGGSVAEAMDVDVDVEVEEESANTEEGTVEDEEERARASSWVAEIQVLIKGKRKLAREEFKSLANTLRLMWRTIAEEGRPLGDDGPPLFDSLWQLAQLEDIPFRDEYKVRSWARRLLKYWPE